MLSGVISQSAPTRQVVLAQDPAERWQLPRAEVLPVTYIVGPDGVLRERLLGEQTAAGLQARLAHMGTRMPGTAGM